MTNREEKKRSPVKVAYRKVPLRARPFRIHLVIISDVDERALSHIVDGLHRVCTRRACNANATRIFDGPEKVNRSKFRVPATFCTRGVSRARARARIAPFWTHDKQSRREKAYLVSDS